MREIIIATETNCDLSEDFIQTNGLLVIPHYYNVEEKMYGEEDNRITVKEFYDEMRAGKRVGTAASNPAVIYDKFSEVARAGKDIVFVSFSSALSLGYQNIVNGAKEVMEEYPDCRIEVIDTLSVSLAEGIMIKTALNMKAEGKNIDEITTKLRDMVSHLCVFFTVDDLQYLYRGGRLSRASAVLGTVVNLKPILYVDDEGKLVLFSKTMGRKKSFTMMLDAMEERLGSYKDKQVFIGIPHGDCLEEAELVKAAIEKRFGFKDFMVESIGPSIGAHSGPGSVGVIFLGEKR